MNIAKSNFSQRVLCLLAALTVFLVASAASAAGRVEWKNKAFSERDQSWRLEMAIFLGKAPDVAYVPMKFEFQPTVYFSRDLVDGDKVQENRVPLTGRQPLIEGVEVGFIDSGSGKTESRTRFTFKITRGHGFEAGEYKVAVRDARDGKKIGADTTITLNGENETIDRRAMVFSGEKKKKDKPADADKPKEEGAGSSEKKAEPASNADDKPAASDASEAAEGEGEGAQEPPSIKEKPGGCGCRTAGGSLGNAPLLAALGMLFAWGARRRRFNG